MIDFEHTELFTTNPFDYIDRSYREFVVGLEALADNNDSALIRTCFASHCAHLKIDDRFASRLHHYQVGFVNKNSEHIQFFGGHLLGVNTIKFMPADRDRWFEDILEVDDGPLEDDLRELSVPDDKGHERKILDPEHKKVASDTMNLSCAWLANAIFKSSLDEKKKHQAMTDVFLVLQYKFFTSRYNQHFTFPADKEIAEATYTQLTDKYTIKKLGRWNAVFQSRAEDIISKESIHYETVTKMNSDNGIIYMLNDIQGRIRDMLKNIYDMHLRIKAQGIRVHSTSSIIEHDGQLILKDKTKLLPSYTSYLKSVVADKNSFIKDELVSVIENMMRTMNPRGFRETLEYISDNYQQSHAKNIEEMIEETLVHSFEHLSRHRDEIRNPSNLPALLSTLQGVYMSSRSRDVALIELREKTEKIARNATGSKNDSTIASIRTGVLLYLVLRAYTKNHYSQGT